MSSEGSALSRRSPEVLVPFIGLLFTGLYLLYTIVPFALQGSLPDFAVILVPFSLIFLGAAFGIWRMYRVGYIVAIAMSAIFIIAEGGFIVDALGNPSDLTTFFPVVTILPALVASLLYSVAGVRLVWKKNTPRPPRRAMPLSSTIAILTVGFIAGALIVGAFAGATQSRLLAGGAQHSDITIVKGAGNQGNAAGYYSPVNFTIKVGDTVVWYNGDASTHTVTQTGGSTFDSGNMLSGVTFSYTFDQAGTYQYYCTIHPWMKGTIVVQSG